MKSMHLLKPLSLSCAILFLIFANCGLLDFDNRPTKSKMEGVWQVTEAYDEDEMTLWIKSPSLSLPSTFQATTLLSLLRAP